VLTVGHAENSADPVCGRARNGGAAAPASGRFLHSLECTQPRRLQAALLREQELLRCLEEKHNASLAAARQKRRRKPATGDRVRRRSNNRFDRCRGFPSANMRERPRARAFAASAGGELHPTHLIQRA